ncbi:MAG: aldo/keto reductase [Spirochaetes bacterium]|nr:aldo/keto reductase [Spirochaetota bacterium]
MPDMPKIFSPRRELGTTGFKATQLGIGDVADRAVAFIDCVATIRRTLDAGLNIIDTAPMYENGYSEEIVGAALLGRRDDVFVIDKIDHHDKPVLPQADESLSRLKMDHTDLFLFHAVSSVDAWKKIAAPGGAMHELTECVRSGKTRFRGISTHRSDVAREAVLSGLCDVIMLPVGPVCDELNISEILSLARRHAVGTIGIKTFGAGKLLGDTEGYNRPLQERPRGKVSSGGGSTAPLLPHLSVAECLYYSLTCDPDVTLLGMSFPNEQDAVFEAMKKFSPLGTDAMEQIRQKAAEAMKGKGSRWW